MKLTQRLDRYETRVALPDEQRRRVEEDAMEFTRRLQGYADGFPPSAVFLSESERIRTMSRAAQLAWYMRFKPVQA